MSRSAALLAASAEEQIRALAGCFFRPAMSPEKTLREGLTPAAYVRKVAGGHAFEQAFEHASPAVWALGRFLLSEGK